MIITARKPLTILSKNKEGDPKAAFNLKHLTKRQTFAVSVFVSLLVSVDEVVDGVVDEEELLDGVAELAELDELPYDELFVELPYEAELAGTAVAFSCSARALSIVHPPSKTAPSSMISFGVVMFPTSFAVRPR